MNKQIEEMVKYVPRNITAYDGNPRGLQLYIEQRINIAEALYNAGYRKQEDVAREIFAEIEELMTSLDKRHMQAGNPKQAWGIRNAMWEIAELKKKYGVKEDESEN